MGDTGYARQWLIDAQKDGLPRSAVVVGSHGSMMDETSTTDTLQNLIDITTYSYPELSVWDWEAGGPPC